MNKNILIIDDDIELSSDMSSYLSPHFSKVFLAHSVDEALSMFQENPTDVVLLDICLDTLDGFTICRKIKNIKDTTVILFSGLHDADNESFGFRVGADDFIRKPSMPDVILTRIKRALERKSNVENNDNNDDGTFEQDKIYTFNHWKLNLNTYQLFSPTGKEINITYRSIKLLEVFLKHKNRLLTREQLIECVYGVNHHIIDRGIDVLVCKLRNILSQNNSPELIKTVRNVGYIFNFK